MTESVERLKQREEILQICYWYQGEGLGDWFMPQSVMAFLQADAASVAEAFEGLARDGDLHRGERGFEFTARASAARRACSSKASPISSSPATANASTAAVRATSPVTPITRIAIT